MKAKTIYLLEDDADIRTLIGDALLQDGYQVYPFGTVHAFNRKVLAQLPDLFILDLHLPDGNGAMVAGQLTDHRVGPVPPVIVISGDLDNAKDAISNGARFFLPKPFHMDVLLETVKRLLLVPQDNYTRLGNMR